MSTDHPPFGHADALELLQLVEADPYLSSIDLKVGRYRIQLDRELGTPSTPVAPASSPAPVESETEAPTPTAAATASESSGDVVPANIAGVFYRAPAPGEPPFVDVGDVVEQGQTIGIVEVMKLMNTVVSTVSGIVERVVATDGDAVQFGDTLLIVRPTEATDE